jgi:hypothetical protein
MSTIDSSRRCRTFNSRKAANARAKAAGIRIDFMESSFCGVEWRLRFEARFGESKENNRRHRKWTWMDVEHITENLQSDQRKPTLRVGA